MNSAEAVLSAMEFEDLYKISFWDALIVQASEKRELQGLVFGRFLDWQEYQAVLVICSFEHSQEQLTENANAPASEAGRYTGPD